MNGAEAIEAAVKGEPRPWTEKPNPPGEIEREPFPLDALPSGLRAHVESVAAGIQIPAEIPAVLALATLSAATAGRVKVEARPGWQEPVSLYVASIHPPGTRKSRAFREITAELAEWEAEQIERMALPLRNALDRADVAGQRLDKMKKAAADGRELSKGGGKVTRVDVEAARKEYEAARAAIPPDGRLLAGDVTPEAMVQRMEAQGGRLAIFEPEGGPLQMVAGRYSDSPRLEELKKAHDGEAIIVDRKGSESIRVPTPALTMGLCIQPGVLEALPHGRAFRGEGLLARFLWVHPPHLLGSRLTGPEMPPMDEAARATFNRIARILLDMKVPGEPLLLRLDSEAGKVLHEMEARVEKELADGGRFEPVRDWAGKMAGQAVRVAALLELARRAEEGRDLRSPNVGAWAMEAAARILWALSSHALAVLGSGGDGERTELLEYVLRRAVDLVANPPEEDAGGPSERNLMERVKGRAAIEKTADLRDLLTQLSERGCLRLVSEPVTGPGRTPSPRIEIHPALARSLRTIRRTPPQGQPEKDSANTANGFATGKVENAPPDPLAEAVANV